MRADSCSNQSRWSLIVAVFAQFSIGGSQLTRPNDLWNPFGSSTTPQTIDQLEENVDDIIVPLSLGKVVGRRARLTDLMWTPYTTVRDRPPPGRAVNDWRPLGADQQTTVFVFLGVPFAEPPVADRRLKPPQQLRQFPGDGIVRAFEYRSVCAQDVRARPNLQFDRPYEFQTSEDCLYLNIFSPQVSIENERTFGVLVFFHGGSFQYGAANDWPGHVLASKGVVVVTANYRLGAFGFASTGAPGSGNYGLLDQRLVLQWVREHIYAFSGDAGRVTLVGHGAGAVSAGLHMLMPSTDRESFHAAAAMSGAEVSYHQVITRPQVAYNNTRKLGRNVGCTQQTINEIWACLLGRGTEDIIRATRTMMVEYNRFAFLPNVDGQLIPEPPEKMLRERRVNVQVPYLTGINQNDGSEVLLSERDLAEFTQENFNVDRQFVRDRILDFTLKRNYTENREAVIESMLYQYTYWPDTRSDERARQMYMHFGTDAYYLAPVAQSALLHAQAGSFTYFYVNNYNFTTGALNPAQQKWMPDWMGVCHDCNLYLLFGFPWMPRGLLPQPMRNVQWTDHDKNASEIFMSMLKEFTSEKNPNLPNDYVQWPVLSERERWYLSFNYTLRQVLRDYDWQHVAYWNNYLPQLALLFTTTFSPTVASIRRELIGYKASTGVFVLLFMLSLVLALVFAYLLFERPRRARLLRERALSSEEKYTNLNQSETASSHLGSALPPMNRTQALPLTAYNRTVATRVLARPMDNPGFQTNVVNSNNQYNQQHLSQYNQQHTNTRPPNYYETVNQNQVSGV